MSNLSSGKKGSFKSSDVEKYKDALDKKDIAFQALFSLIEKLGTNLDVKQVVRLFLATLMGQIGLRRVALYLPGGGERVMIPYHSIGLGREAILPQLERGCAFMRWLEKSNGFVHIDTFFNSAGNLKGEYQDLKTIIDTGFAYALPMVEKDETIGVLFLSNKVVGERFSEFDVELIVMISTVASITIRNAWLYQKTFRAKTELENFSKVKKQFINHTSHELRTPLTVINSAICSINGEGGDDILLNMVKGAVENLKNKVELLLSLNDIELREDTINLDKVDVYSMLEDCLRGIIAEVEEKRVKVSLNNKAGFREIKADPSKIKIVFKSLIDNALNYVGEGGRIEIEIQLSDRSPGEDDGVEIRGWDTELREDNSISVDDTSADIPSVYGGLAGEGFEITSGSMYMVIRVKDNGIGIPEEEIGLLSEPFKRASNSPLTDVKGLGIGLSISQRIVAGHRGKLFCKSEESGGSEFSVWLPLVD
jgi:signal transduction histidine kinase